MEFEGQVAVVTGGTRGIGAAVARRLHDGGALVVATYREREAQARELAESAGDRLHVRRADVTDASAVEALFSEIDDKWGRLDAVVANAGIREDGVVAMLPEGAWDRVLDTNLKGTFLVAKHAVQRMSRARYGRIVFVTSPSGRLGFPGQGNYAAAKAGQVGLCRSLAQEVARRGITVNCLSPGFVETELIGDLTEELRERYRQMVPAGRFAKTEEVAEAAAFLLSRGASYVNGAVLDVTGGL